LSDGTVLLVEDEPDDAHLLIRAFRKAGIMNPMRHLQDGDEAVAYLSAIAPYDDRQKHPFPIVTLLDLKLPRRSGFEVIEWIRGEPLLKRLPVIVLTSSAHGSDVSLAYDLGANSYLVKPVAAAALDEMVETVHAYWIRLNRPADMASG
jgi:CheY-like chemotaxis protein